MLMVGSMDSNGALSVISVHTEITQQQLDRVALFSVINDSIRV